MLTILHTATYIKIHGFFPGACTYEFTKRFMTLPFYQ